MKCHASVHHKLNVDSVSQSWRIASIAIPNPHLATLTDATAPTRLGLPGANDVSGALRTPWNETSNDSVLMNTIFLIETFNDFWFTFAGLGVAASGV